MGPDLADHFFLLVQMMVGTVGFRTMTDVSASKDVSRFILACGTMMAHFRVLGSFSSRVMNDFFRELMLFSLRTRCALLQMVGRLGL